MDELIYRDESFQIVGAAMEVWNTQGYGFLESVYESSLTYELKDRGLDASRQVRIPVMYTGRPAGDFVADILVNGSIILELKSAERVANAHIARALNYLKTTGLRLAIVLNFGKERLEYKRVVL